MPRNGSGSYSLPEAAFIPNTAISSGAVNSDFSDIGDALTDSLARDGQGGMTAVLPLANTGFTYLSDPNTGMRRTAADTQAIFSGGTDIVTFTSTAMNVTGIFQIAGVAVFPLATANIADKAVTYAKIQDVINVRLLGNPTVSSAAVQEIPLGSSLEFTGNTTLNLSAARRTLPTRQVFTTGSGTYTTPANCLYIKVRLVGGGAGGGGSGSSGAGTGGSGGNTTFSTFTANGGVGGGGSSSTSNAGGAGGSASGGTINLAGQNGAACVAGAVVSLGGAGGGSAFFHGAGQPVDGGGGSGTPNTGGGGAGGSRATNAAAGSGGGAGGSCEGSINSPAVTYLYAVGANGSSGTAGIGGNNGGSGALGFIIVEEFYN